MEFYGIIKDGKITLSNIQKELRQQYLTSLKDGTLIKETLTKTAKDKTYQQVKTIFGLVITTIINEFNDRGWDSSILLNTEKPTGIATSKGLLKEFFYSVCPIEDDEGNITTLSKATIEQAMKFINNTRDWVASQWGIYVPDPDPNWREIKDETSKQEG